MALAVSPPTNYLKQDELCGANAKIKITYMFEKRHLHHRIDEVPDNGYLAQGVQEAWGMVDQRRNGTESVDKISPSQGFQGLLLRGSRRRQGFCIVKDQVTSRRHSAKEECSAGQCRPLELGRLAEGAA